MKLFKKINVKLFGNIKKKVRSDKGESLAEVLIAVLVSSLGLVLLASMITTSVNLVNKSKKTMADYVTKETNVVSQPATENTGEISLTLNLAGKTSIPVYYYKDDVVGNKTVYTYKRNNSASTSGGTQ